MSWPITAKQAKEMSTLWISSGQWINQQEITYIYMHWKTWNISFFFLCCNTNFMIFEFYEQTLMELSDIFWNSFPCNLEKQISATDHCAKC